jgi:hypothetical protein
LTKKSGRSSLTKSNPSDQGNPTSGSWGGAGGEELQDGPGQPHHFRRRAGTDVIIFEIFLTKIFNSEVVRSRVL